MQDLLTRLNDVQTLANTGRLIEAENACRAIVAEATAMPEATALLGFIVSRLNRLHEACALLENAAAIRADVPHWHLELSNLHRRAFRLEAALAAARTAVRLAPGEARYYVGLARVFVDLEQNDAARDALLAALHRAPEDVEAHLALAHLLLAEGEYGAGFAEYEWRFRAPRFQTAMPRFDRPAWNGMRLPGRRILVAADQGFGDAFQFCRYLPMVAERCAGVVVLCRAAQIPLFSRIEGVAACVVSIHDAGPHAAWCWMASLPKLFGTSIATIPDGGAYLSPDPERREAWRAELDRSVPRPGRRTGLVWAGNPDNTTDWRRSIPLSLLAPLGEINGFRPVSLQLQVPEADRAAMAGLGLFDLSPRLTDFGETAAAIANLDLVIAVDSAVAHLAGAMGVPTWILIYQPADWRWMTDREDNPWYPSVRLFRQTRAGDWREPVARLIAKACSLT